MESGRKLVGKLGRERMLRGHKKLITALGGPWADSVTSEFVNCFSSFGHRTVLLYTCF